MRRLTYRGKAANAKNKLVGWVERRNPGDGRELIPDFVSLSPGYAS